MAPCEYCEAGEHWRCNLSVHCSCDCNPEDPSTYMPDINSDWMPPERDPPVESEPEKS